MEAAPESDAEIDVPHADEVLIKFICGFLEQHKDDEEVGEGWEKQKPRELIAWDKANLAPIVGLALVNLLKVTQDWFSFSFLPGLQLPWFPDDAELCCNLHWTNSCHQEREGSPGILWCPP
jgi:hypothetical protein